jgi:hypothetical protein
MMVALAEITVTTMLTGGCRCGAIRYKADAAPLSETNCHCEDCRETTGAPFVAWLTVPASTFRFTQGAPVQFQSSEHAARTFCGVCGTALTFRSTKFADEVDVTICSLDEPEKVRPKSHTWTRSQLSWIELADGLPTFDKSRSG